MIFTPPPLFFTPFTPCGKFLPHPFTPFTPLLTPFTPPHTKGVLSIINVHLCCLYSSVSISSSVPSRKWKCRSPPSWTSTLSNTMFTISGHIVSSGGSAVSYTICPARHFSKVFPSVICFFHAGRKLSLFSTMPFHAVRNACSKSFSKRLLLLQPATPFCW